ncbi:MAG: peptide ABC transporter permease [Bacillota bacterium]|nr:MAG: peptide ABC transporter permease [Bacillota bacterium]
MTQYIIRRLLLTVPLILGAATLVFIALRLAPGDPAQILLGTFATEERVAQLHAQFGLDQPIHVQYWRFLVSLARGDLGVSFLTRQPVMEEIRRVFPYSLVLSVMATGLAALLAIPLAVLAAPPRGSAWDFGPLSLAMLLVSMPTFWLGIVLMSLFAVNLRWFPSIGGGSAGNLASMIYHATLPAIALSGPLLAFMARLTRANMHEVMASDFIRTARAKGLAERVVIYKHALRNAMIPVLSVLGLGLGQVMGGSVIIEVVFARPGLGKLLVDSITGRDYLQVQACIIVLAAIFVLVNLLTDLSYALVDPRVRYQ